MSHSHSSMFCLLLCIAGVTKRYQHFMDSDQFLKVAFCGSKQIQTAHLNPFKPYWAMRIHISVAKAPQLPRDRRCNDGDQLVTDTAPPWHCHSTKMSVQRWADGGSQTSRGCRRCFPVKIPQSDCPSQTVRAIV